MAKHECVIEGCAKKVDVEWCLCSEHFRMVPDDLRVELVRVYDCATPRDEQGRGFLYALAAVHGWIRETFGAQDRKAKPSWEHLVAWVRGRDAARAARR